MIDEELHRVLVFLVDTLNKCPGWTHQGMLRQELFTAQLEGSLHQILGASSAEMFTEFLRSFPTIFCVNHSQLVQLCTKNGSVSELSGLPLNDGGGLGPGLKPPDDCGGLSSLNIMPVGTRKPLDPPHLEWTPSPLSMVPESTKMGYLGREPPQPMQPTSNQLSGNICGIPASYPGSSGIGQRTGGWDPVAHSLPDLHQSFLGPDINRGRSLGHLTNGWDRPARTNTVPNCQSRYAEGGSGDSSRLPLNHRYTWENTSHSITDSLKNFSLSDTTGYPGANVSTLTNTGRNRWLPYPAMSSDSLDGFPNHNSGNGHFLRPLGSMWDEPLRPSTPPSQPQPPPQQSFLGRVPNDTGLSSHNSFQWDDAMPTSTAVSDHSSPLGFTGFGLSAPKQQYYEWKSPSPALAENPAFPNNASETPKSVNEERSIIDSVPVEAVEKSSASTIIVTPTTAAVTDPSMAPISTPMLSMSEEMKLESPPLASVKSPATLGLSPLGDLAAITTTISTPAVSATPPTVAVALKQGATLSYAEALRSNTQRRKVGSDNSSNNCVQTPYSVQMPPTSLKLSISNMGSVERQNKSRRSLDGRCGKVETLNANDGTLRLGNGKVYFEKTVFYDSGKQVADLRNILKPNDTVYFDAMLDGSGSHDWKATLAWVGKKPRSASASSPTTSVPVGRGYRSVENHGCNSTSNNGFPVRGGASSLTGNNKMTKDQLSVMEATVEGTGEVVILFAHFGFIRRGKKFKENVHFNRNVFYASGNRVKELTDTLKEGSMVNYVAVPSDKKSCKWKAVLVWTGARPKV